MIERFFEPADDVELIDKWMSTPPSKRGDLSEALADKLERLTRAHRWLMAHHSRKRVWPMMHAYYNSIGRKYSESTARQDVIDAERLFMQWTPHHGPWITHLMIDSLYEEYHSALRRGDHNSAHKFADRLDRYIERYDRYIEARSKGQTDPRPILAVFNPEEAGIKPLGQATLSRIAEFRREREALKNNRNADIRDADFTEE